MSFADSLVSFSHDIYQDIDATESACVSPFSIISAFFMLMAGTSGRSKTQIKSTILSKPLNDALINQQYKALSGQVFNATNNELYIASKLYVKEGLSVTNKVRNIAKTYFNSDIGHKDFTTVQQSAIEINNYVASKTSNKITNLVSSNWLSSATVMVLVNALYYKGTWETQFDPTNTTKQDFYVTQSKKVKVDMMAMQHYVLYYNGKDYSAIRLPYKGGMYDMVVVLPKQIDGFNKLKTSFSPATVKIIESNMVNTSVIINLPKFTFESETDLKILLPKIGITDIFTPALADFSALIQGVSNSNMYVSEARHKVVIEVNEKGTQAAAGTTIVITWSTISFIADHPFLFYIKHRLTGTILFIGHYKP